MIILSQVLWGYINGIQLANFGLLIHLIEHHQYKNACVSEIKGLSFFLYKICIIGVREKIGTEKGTEKGTVCSHGDADDLLKNVPCEPNRYIMLSLRISNILMTSFSV